MSSLSSTIRVLALWALPGLGLLPNQVVCAQEYRQEKLPEVGIEITVSNRLKRLPNKLDDVGGHLKARFRPEDAKDYVQTREGPYWWYTNVREFKKPVKGPTTGERKPGDPGAGEPPEDPPKDPPTDPKLKEMLERFKLQIGDGEPVDFAKWVESEKPVQMLTKGKEMKARSSFLPYKHWEWVTTEGTPLEWYNAAAVYDFEDREVALIVSMPLTKGRRPVGKFSKFMKRCITSGRLLKDGEDDLDSSASKDKYADTEKKKQALDAAKKNIQSLRDWDYFTTPNYIVLFSWDKPGGRMNSYKFCKRLSGLLEKMRTLYEEYYPPLPDMGQPYSVFRVCASYSQFGKYGDSPPGAVGWYSPRSKELVVFQGGDKIMHKGATDAVAFHEGWHQYADSYFGGVELHRWFDEGHGDYFGAHEKRGSGWRYVGSKMRYPSCRTMVRKGDFVAFDKIVTWNKDKFYTSRGHYYYAQAYSMIDFFRRGDALGRKWDQRWAEILPIYRATMLQEKDQTKAVEAAFKGVDYRKLEEVWKDWVDSPYFKKG